MKKQFSIIFGIILLVISMPSLMGGLVFQQDSLVDLKIGCFNEQNEFCDNTVVCNLTVFQPNHQVIVNNKIMTWNSAYFNYTLNTSQTSKLGEHSVIGVCAGNSTGFSTFTFEITPSGFEAPEGIVIIFFSALFVLVVIGMLSLLMHTIFHFINLDYDSKDLTYSLSAYFGLFAVYILSMEYLRNTFIDDFLLFLIEVGAVTMVFLPIIAFVVSFIKSNTEKGDHN